MKICKICGKEINDTALWCEYCGERQPDENPSPAPDNTEENNCEKDVPNSNKKLIKIFFITVAVVFVVSAVMFSLFKTEITDILDVDYQDKNSDYTEIINPFAAYSLDYDEANDDFIMGYDENEIKKIVDNIDKTYEKVNSACEQQASLISDTEQRDFDKIDFVAVCKSEYQEEAENRKAEEIRAYKMRKDAEDMSRIANEQSRVFDEVNKIYMEEAEKVANCTDDILGRKFADNHRVIPIPDQEKIRKYGACSRCHGSGIDPVQKRPVFGRKLNGLLEIQDYIPVLCTECYGSGYTIPQKLKKETDKYEKHLQALEDRYTKILELEQTKAQARMKKLQERMSSGQ